MLSDVKHSTFTGIAQRQSISNIVGCTLRLM